MLIAALCFVAFAVGMGVFVSDKTGLVLGGMFLILFVFLGFMLPAQAKTHRRLWAEMLREHPGLETDPLATALRAAWRRSWKNLAGKPARIREVLRAAGGPDERGPWIACIGFFDIPEVGERRFEPYIITAGELLGGRLWSIPIAAIVVALLLLQLIGVVPGHASNFGGFLYVVIMGVAVGATWLWRTGIRPTYVRAAPGIIQIVQYRIGARKPMIRSYRMEPGTLVVITGGLKPKQVPVSVRLSCEQHQDVLPIGQMRNKVEAMERIWWALLSTAPIPRMDDEQLVG